MNKLTLYYSHTCPFSQKVLHFINDRKISLELKNIKESSSLKQELIEIGGKKQVPCLVIDGNALYESSDIINWLDENCRA